MILYFRGGDNKPNIVSGTVLDNRMVTIQMPDRPKTPELKMSVTKLYLDPEFKHSLSFAAYKKTGLSV